MAYIDIEKATAKELVEYLLDYWHTDSLVFEGDFKPANSPEASVSGSFINITSVSTHKLISHYPQFVKGQQDVYFTLPKNKMQVEGHYVFECQLAPKTIRDRKNNPFALIVKPNSIKSVTTPTRSNNTVSQSSNKSRTSIKDYNKTLDLPLDDKDTSELGIIRWRLNLKNYRFIAQFSLEGDEYLISDIRRSDFSKLIMHDMEQLAPFKAKLDRKISNGYYEFTWKIVSADFENNVYCFTVDKNKPFVRVYPQDIVQKLKDNIMGEGAASAQRTVRSIDTLKTQLTDSGKEIFIYELLQNANDYPQKINNIKQPVDVEFHITDKYLIFMHTGAVFSERNIASICDINDKDKTDSTDTIGYKGIGFKTVFVDNNYVYLSTGKFHLRFDWEYSRHRVTTAWQLLPIWTDISEVDEGVLDIFKRTYKRFPVQFALRPTNPETLRQSDQNFVKLFKEVFANERVILFIPYVNSVKVFFHDGYTEDIVREKNNQQWVVNTYKQKIKEEIRQSINAEIDRQKENGTLKIPTKYYNFKETSVSFACPRKEFELSTLDDALLYCYLPAKRAKWGFKFLMNTDMIPNGPRNDIELDLEVNKEIAYIAGQKFFEWILTLCKEQKYKIDTIFQLVPDFEECKNGIGKNYKELIEKFEKGFEERLETEEFIPIGSKQFRKISDIIYDETGLSSTNTISDANFVQIASEGKFLPMKVLRSNKEFMVFLKRYLKKFGFTSNIWNKANLIQSLSSEKMATWLKVQDNNNKFIRFILDKKWLSDLEKCAIFLGADENLHVANTIYHSKNIFDKISYLHCFEDLIPHLTSETISYFNEDKDWEEQTKGLFITFKSKTFISDVLLSAKNKENTLKLLKTKLNSLHFYSFLAKYVNLYKDEQKKSVDEEMLSLLKGLPFFGFTHKSSEKKDQDVAFDNFTGNIFLKSEKALSFAERPWIKPEWLIFLSTEYTKEVVEYITLFYGVFSFTDDLALRLFIRPYVKTETLNSYPYTSKQIKVPSPYKEDICKFLEEWSVNKNFFDYCLTNSSSFEKKDLYWYPLFVNDRDNTSTLLTHKDGYRFYESQLLKNLEQKEWIKKEWFYELSHLYFDNLDEKNEEEVKKFKDFYTSMCGIYEFSDSLFCSIITLKPFFEEIIKKISIPSFDNSKNGDAEYVSEHEKAKETAIIANVDFIKFVDSKYELFIDDETNSLPDIFKTIIINDGNTNIPLGQNIYYPNAELSSILKDTWFPDSIKIYIANPEYGELKILDYLGIKKYTFAEFYNEIIVGNEYVSIIKTNITEFSKNVAFHNYVISKVSTIADDKLKLLESFPVFVIGSSASVAPSEEEKQQNGVPAVLTLGLCNHRILSTALNELFEKNLVKASDLDLIHPNYNPNSSFDCYWSKFDNKELENNDFVQWIIANKAVFTQTISSNSANVDFWRWAKNNIAEHNKLQELTFLPVQLQKRRIEDNTDESINDLFSTLTNTIHISDKYLGTNPMESFIKMNDPKAFFISDKYIDDNENTESISKWLEFWKRLGVKSDILSVINSTIITKLSEIENESLPGLFAKYELELRSLYPDLPNKLSSMKVKTTAGFLPFSSVVYININSSEPFDYIKLPNAISFIGKDAAISTLMLSVAIAANSKIINSVLDWRKAKIQRYIELQAIKEKELTLTESNAPMLKQEEIDAISSFDFVHLSLIKDLASIKADRQDSITDLSTSISSLKLFSEANKLLEPSKLTEGSVYKPLCDFQSCKVDSHTYISERYSSIPNIKSLLESTLKVQSGFSEKDIPYLENYIFANYFWTIFLAKNISGYQEAQSTILGFFRGKKFDNVKCIPTGTTVKAPSELYFGSSLEEYTPMISEFKEKIPAVSDILFEENGTKVSLLSLLPFKKEKLDLEDCFDALVRINDQKRRPKLLSWIVSQYNSSNASHQNYLKNYRSNPNASWFNGINEPKRIDELYALDEPNGKLSFYFGSHPKIFNTNYFPKGEDYLKACSCLEIRVIHDNSTDMVTDHVKSENPDIRESDLKKHLCMVALILSGIENGQEWEPIYNKFVEKINNMQFVCCESIILRYVNDQNISNDSKRFYHPSNSNAFYYVDNYKDPRLFTDFVGEFISYLDIKVDKDIVLNVMFDKKSAFAEIEKRNNLIIDEKFMDFMEAYELGIKSHYHGRIADETPTAITTPQKPIEVVSLDRKTENISIEEKPTGKEDPQVNNDESKDNKCSDTNTTSNSRPMVQEKESTPIQNESSFTQTSSLQHLNQKTFITRLDPNKYKRRPMNVGTQNPTTMGINRVITEDEIRQLSDILGRAMEVETIMNENYIVRLRFYNEVVKKYGDAKMDIKQFVESKQGYLELTTNKFIHRCSARGGTLYISPTIWNMLLQENCIVCMYYGKFADEFLFIETQEQLMGMIDKDAIVIQVTGNDKKSIVDKVYDNEAFGDKSGNIYTLIRTIKDESNQLLYTSPDDIPSSSYQDEDIDPDLV